MSWLDCEQYGKNLYKKHNQHSSGTQKGNTINIVQCSKVKITFALFVTDPLIIPMIYVFLFCRKKAHDNKEFSRENSKPRGESQITNR